MKIAIIGGGNLGMSIARGITANSMLNVEHLKITRKNKKKLKNNKEGDNFVIGNDNIQAVQNCTLIILAVLPQQCNEVLDEVMAHIDPKKHIIVSVVTGVTILDIEKKIGKKLPIVRAMPNIATAIQNSMTCIASNTEHPDVLEPIITIFKGIGQTKIISEELMISATALCACGIAFYLRMIRSISQAGIEIGFHSDEALAIALQTAKGAAMLLEEDGGHPEALIDKVTSPQGCTIVGLNEMEHNGFSSSLIKGVKTSFKKAKELYK